MLHVLHCCKYRNATMHRRVGAAGEGFEPSIRGISTDGRFTVGWFKPSSPIPPQGWVAAVGD